MPRKHKPRMGRPPLGDRARTKSIAVKLSQLEYDAIAAAVKRENSEGQRDDPGWTPTTISSWLRDHALDPLGMMPESSED